MLAETRVEAGNQRQGEKHREMQARREWPIGTHRRSRAKHHSETPKGKTTMRGRVNGEKQRLRSKPKDSTEKKERREQAESETTEKQGWGRDERGEEERSRERRVPARRVILTKETGGGAGRKSFPHQHILFQKSSKLSWNESERITESQPARERRKRWGVRKGMKML